MSNKLAAYEVPQTQLAPAERVLESITSGRLTPEQATQALSLYKEITAMNAAKEFGQAFAEMQAEMPKVVAERFIPRDDGTVRSRFAAFEDIMKVVQPHLSKHKFSISWDSKFEEARITAICILIRDGHSERREFSVRYSPPPKSSPAQGDGATLTYAKRYALCNMLNISIDKDSDAAAEGDLISPEDAQSLRTRLLACGGNEARFLEFSDAKAWGEIRNAAYPRLDTFLKSKEKDKGGGSGTSPATAPYKAVTEERDDTKGIQF